MTTPYDSRSGRFLASNGFTLLELLTVVLIVAILIAILVPALSGGREQARIVKCMANQRTLAQGVHAFANDHRGYGQIVASSRDFRFRYLPEKYEYEKWPPSVPPSNNVPVPEPTLAPWPVAYANYIGAPGLRTESFLVGLTEGATYVNSTPIFNNLKLLENKRRVPVLECPSERHVVSHVLTFPSGLVGPLTYAINHDIFGAGPHLLVSTKGHGVWRNGPGSGARLSGRLDRVIRPSEVALCTDGGGIQPLSLRNQPLRDVLFSWAGPYLGDFSAVAAGDPLGYHTLPSDRHSTHGGLVGTYVDGHGEYLRPVRWATVKDGLRVPTRYSPDPRITPYEPGGPVRGGQHRR